MRQAYGATYEAAATRPCNRRWSRRDPDARPARTQPSRRRIQPVDGMRARGDDWRI